MLERIFFDSWMYLVMDPITNNFNYREEYAVDIKIIQFPEAPSGGNARDGYQMVPNYSTSLISAYPVSINAQELGYDTNDSIQKVQVTFSYKYAVPYPGFVGNQSIGEGRRGNAQVFTETVAGPTPPSTK